MEKLDVNVSKYYTVTGNPSRAILFQGIVKTNQN